VQLALPSVDSVLHALWSALVIAGRVLGIRTSQSVEIDHQHDFVKVQSPTGKHTVTQCCSHATPGLHRVTHTSQAVCPRFRVLLVEVRVLPHSAHRTLRLCCRNCSSYLHQTPGPRMATMASSSKGPCRPRTMFESIPQKLGPQESMAPDSRRRNYARLRLVQVMPVPGGPTTHGSPRSPEIL
jgi:hypothetical protein